MRPINRALITAVIAAFTASSVSAPAAQAAPATAPTPPLVVNYDATGAARLGQSGAKLVIAPTTLSLSVRQDQTFTATMPIAPIRTEFTDESGVQFGLTAHFTPTGAGITGSYRGTPGGIAIRGSARLSVRISHVTVRAAGAPPSAQHVVPVGPRCITKRPAVVPVSTRKGDAFDPTTGGVLGGAFTVPKFANCNGFDDNVSALAAGPGNRARIKATNGQAQP